ncbi:SNF2-related protein [Peribacillus sp. NPDC101480]|uniref:SNF2-related protein n=1 Tax=Peribacillus sp. NPDC101480 TaxID=3390620 RepID=UPI003D067566
MNKLIEGMYVRCPIDNEHPELPRRFALGQVIEVNELMDEVKVKFYEINPQLMITTLYQISDTQSFPISDVVHCEIYMNTEIKINSKQTGSIINKAESKKNGYYQYYVKFIQGGKSYIEVFTEEKLLVPFSASNSDPIYQLKSYEFHNPVWYHNRQVVSGALHTLTNATFGFETLVGSRVFLMSHQVDTIVRAISENPCRFMLADEVGLGKTIQAGVIKKGLEYRLGKMKVIIIAPESLVYQWKNELYYKFWEEIPVWTEGDLNPPDQMIFPLEKVNTNEGIRVLREKWDLCIIDETHRLLNLEAEYSIIERLSKRVQHLLLLSATPIQSRRTEYLKLLRLLQPEKYSKISRVEFDQLIEKQAYLSGKIHGLVRDLDDYDEDVEFFIEELEDVVEELNDSILEGLVAKIDVKTEDQGLSDVRLVLAYIAEHYQIERKIIRHRRKELGEKLAKRSSELVSYDMKGADELFYEFESYDKLLDYLSEFPEEDAKYKKLFLSAMFSSPFALESILNNRKRVVTENGFNATTAVITRSNTSIIESTRVIANEKNLLNELCETVSQWKAANTLELKRFEELYDEPDKIKGRLMKVLDYISESLSGKIVIFTSWKETLTEVKSVLINKFGEDSVRTFHSGMSDQELQRSVDDFQQKPNCQFMICDELGGEGRNFQIADEVIHIDLPWSPSMLEQRIGRLDRIGREKEVLSVVFVTEESVESDLYSLWDEGLNIFKESLSGLEIALGDINEQIDQALTTNIRHGLSDVLETMQSTLEDMRKKVEIERYYDMARQLDENVQEQLTNLINKFDGNNGELLAKTMMSWANLAGLNGKSGEHGEVTVFTPEGVSLRSMKNTLLIPPFNMQEAHKRSKRAGEVRGTFNRRKAVEREDLIFYAPGEPFFDSIVNNASSSDLGRCSAFYRKNTGVNWKGFILTWSVSIDPSELLDKNQEIENLVLAQGYVPLEQYHTIHGYDELDQSIDTERIRIILSSYGSTHKAEHLGKRGNGRVTQFKELFPKDEWIPKVEQVFEQSYQEAQQLLSKMIDVKRAETDFQRRLDGRKAANIFFNKIDIKDVEELDELSNIYNSLLEGLKRPKITLESAAFGWLVE